MIVYSENNIGLLFLSPYVKVTLYDNRIVFFHTLLESSVTLSVPRDWQDSLCKFQKEGATKETYLQLFRTYFSEESSQQLFTILLRKGILE